MENDLKIYRTYVEPTSVYEEYNVRYIEGRNFIKNLKKEISYGDTFLKISEMLGDHSHCVSKKVGAILVKDNRILTTGINGTPINTKNCDDLFSLTEPDVDSSLIKYDPISHHTWSINNEIHAEVNCIAMAAREGISVKDTTLYCNYWPCINCAKLIAACSIKSIVFRYEYLNDFRGMVLLIKSGIECYRISDTELTTEIRKMAL